MSVHQGLSLLVGLALASLAARAPAAANGPDTTPPTDSVDCVHTVLTNHGALYVGTVTDVKQEGAWRHTNWGTPVLDVYGQVTLRVERTLWGPPVDEFRCRYLFTQSAPPDPPVLDSGGHVWDRYPPRPGMRLALLVMGGRYLKEYDNIVEAEGPVDVIWPAPKDDPFIEDLADACKLLGAKEVGEQKALIRRLGRSKYATIRYLVREIVFERGDDEAQPERVLEYLRAADAGTTQDAERSVVTGNLFEWLNHGKERVKAPAETEEDAEPHFRSVEGGHWKGLPEDLRATVEDWVLGELAARTERGLRAAVALRGLNNALTQPGAADALAVFKRAGRAGLLERVKAADTPDDEDKKTAQELQDMLQGGMKPPATSATGSPCPAAPPTGIPGSHYTSPGQE